MPTDGSDAAPPVLDGMFFTAHVTPALSLRNATTCSAVSPSGETHCELSGT